MYFGGVSFCLGFLLLIFFKLRDNQCSPSINTAGTTVAGVLMILETNGKVKQQKS